jgi:DNA repair exonuclease SbcCD ATPase subunit
MKKTLTANDIANELHADDNAGWSWAGAQALGEWLAELDDASGEDTEFDRVAIRCDFSEYESALEAAQEYGFEPEAWACPCCGEELDEDAEVCEECGKTDSDWNVDKEIHNEKQEKAALAWLSDRTSVISFDGGVIVPCF